MNSFARNKVYVLTLLSLPCDLARQLDRMGVLKEFGIGVLKEFVSLTMVVTEMRKKTFSYHSKSCKDEKVLHQNLKSFTFELPPKKLS